jgi:hypothetical protein
MRLTETEIGHEIARAEYRRDKGASSVIDPARLIALCEEVLTLRKERVDSPAPAAPRDPAPDLVTCPGRPEPHARGYLCMDAAPAPSAAPRVIADERMQHPMDCPWQTGGRCACSFRAPSAAPDTDPACAKCGCLRSGHHGAAIGCEGAGGTCGCDGVFASPGAGGADAKEAKP